MASHRILALVRDVWPEIRTALNTPWEPPKAISHAVFMQLRASRLWEEIKLDITVAGAPDQHILCLQGDSQLVLCSPGMKLDSHPFVRELVEELEVDFEEHSLSVAGDCLIAPLTETLKTRLTLPSVLLVSLFHPEMYPAARLTLGIAYLTSYLRLRHLATVKLIDCQFGPTLDDVLAEIRESHPDFLGISVNFGQFDLMEQLLDKLYREKAAGEPPVVILGNILPAMCYREILEAYPEVVICRKEGELSLAGLARAGRDRSRWSQVPGVYYLSKVGKLVSTPPTYLPMEQLPTPALDTVPELFARDGVITAEFSRGCQYNKCSFCPRSHKGGVWRSIPVASMLQQWETFMRVFQHFGRTPHVFLADEDFVGVEDADATVQRLTDFLNGARERNLQITFDASCRADQIFREGCDRDWHLQRGRLFKRCVEGGLSRLFLGVESGASAQLKRYNKGSCVDEMISAIRYLSLLGARLRFGFIFFDPLMSVQDLVDNIEFLGRTDIVLPAAQNVDVEEIWDVVCSNHRRIMHEASGRPIYEDVSYMVSPLEVLSKSKYLYDLRQQAPQLISGQIDVSFARYRTDYAIPELGNICMACQYWVNYCFPIVYALKGLQKVSSGAERKLLHEAISHHRYLGYMLIRSLAQAFSLVDDITVQHWEQVHASMQGHQEICAKARELIEAREIDNAIISILTWYEEQMRRLMETVNEHASTLSPSKQQVWSTTYNAWVGSSLVNTPVLRMA